MPRAVITLEDTPEGGIGMTCFLETGFQVSSNAHQAANLMISHMDTLGMKSNEDTKWVSGAEAEWITGAPGTPIALPVAPSEQQEVASRLEAANEAGKALQ